MSKNTLFFLDLLFYGCIGALSTAQSYVASGDLPRYWLAPIGITLGALLAIKAKLSKGATPTDPEPTVTPPTVNE